MVPMRVRSRTLLAWSLWLATLGCLVGGLVVTLFVTRPLTSDVLVTGAFDGAVWLLFATIGLVLTLRRPANPIGWLYAAAGLVWSLYVPWDPWVDLLLRTGRPLPLAARLAALAGDSLWAVGITLAITLPLLLLPNGRLRSRRWRVVVVVAVAGTHPGGGRLGPVAGPDDPDPGAGGQAVPAGRLGRHGRRHRSAGSAGVCCSPASRRRPSVWCCGSGPRVGSSASSCAGSPPGRPWPSSGRCC